MKKQVFNPYLPLSEYTPDCEPHIFNGRLYVYGSHDCYGEFPFSHNNYVTWSAPLDDLSDWRYEGEIFDKKEDPLNRDGKLDLYAPDVTQGPDGNYYLYYSLAWQGTIGVAKSSSPAGPFKHIGNVHYKDGTDLGRKKGDAFHFDPGAFTDTDGRVYLYSGFGAITWFPMIRHHLKPEGGFGMELEPDMMTIKNGPIKLFSMANEENINGVKEKEHAFFEASSLRKIGETYYFIYSSLAGHELCYMTSSSPLGPFAYQGVIISNGDVGLNGRKKEDSVTPTGNNHGSIVQVEGQWYVFYHRHTNYTNTDRQDCAEPIEIDRNGKIKQVEITSCGLNMKPLEGKGEYPASICCYYHDKKPNVFYPFFALPHQKRKLRIHQDGTDSKPGKQYIQNIGDSCVIGYKYFDLSNTHKITLKYSGSFAGEVSVSFLENGENKYTHAISKGGNEVSITIDPQRKKEALYLHFKGSSKLDLYSIIFD